MTCDVNRCYRPATMRLVWDDSGLPELCCDQHADDHARNNNVMARAILETLQGE